MRSASVTLGMTVLVASALAGCGNDEYYTTTEDGEKVCVDPDTKKVVDDYECDDNTGDYNGYSHGGGYYWFYMPHGTTHPAVGSPYDPSSGSYHASTYHRTVTHSGGSSSSGHTSRGGFGGFHLSSS